MNRIAYLLAVLLLFSLYPAEAKEAKAPPDPLETAEKAEKKFAEAAKFLAVEDYHSACLVLNRIVQEFGEPYYKMAHSHLRGVKACLAEGEGSHYAEYRAENFMRLSRTCALGGEYEAAVKFLDRALEAYPEKALANRENRWLYLLLGGRIGESIAECLHMEELCRGKRSGPWGSKARSNRDFAKRWEERKYDRNAVPWFYINREREFTLFFDINRLVEIAARSDNPRQKAEAYHDIYGLLAGLGDDSSLEAWEAAFDKRLGPGNGLGPRIMREKAQWEVDKGDPERGLALYEKIALKYAGSEEAFTAILRIGKAYWRMRRYDEAIAANLRLLSPEIEKLADTAPADNTKDAPYGKLTSIQHAAAFALYECYIAKGDKKDALKWLVTAEKSSGRYGHWGDWNSAGGTDSRLTAIRRELELDAAEEAGTGSPKDRIWYLLAEKYYDRHDDKDGLAELLKHYEADKKLFTDIALSILAEPDREEVWTIVDAYSRLSEDGANRLIEVINRDTFAGPLAGARDKIIETLTTGHVFGNKGYTIASEALSFAGIAEAVPGLLKFIEHGNIHEGRLERALESLARLMDKGFDRTLAGYSLFVERFRLSGEKNVHASRYAKILGRCRAFAADDAFEFQPYFAKACKEIIEDPPEAELIEIALNSPDQNMRLSAAAILCYSDTPESLETIAALLKAKKDRGLVLELVQVAGARNDPIVVEILESFVKNAAEEESGARHALNSLSGMGAPGWQGLAQKIIREFGEGSALGYRAKRLLDHDADRRDIEARPPRRKDEPEPPTGTITGKVIDSVTGEGIAGAKAKKGRRETETGPDGGFTLEADTGKSALHVRAEGYVWYFPYHVAVSADETTQVTIRLDPCTATVAGKVVDAATGKPLKYANGTVMPGEYGRLFKNRGIGFQSTEDGTFSAACGPGKYRLNFRTSKYVSPTVEFEIAAGERKEFEIALEPVSGRTAITGVAIDNETGAPLKGVRITLGYETDSTSSRLKTDPEGGFRSSVRHGDIWIKAYSDGYVCRDLRIHIKRGEVKKVTLRMSKWGAATVFFRVIDAETGKLIETALASVRLNRSNGGEHVRHDKWSGYDAKLKGWNEAVIPPHARIRIWAPGYLAKEFLVEGLGYDTRDLGDFKLDPLPKAAATLRVTPAYERSPSGYGWRFQVLYRGTVLRDYEYNNTGEFELRVPAGEILVVAYLGHTDRPSCEEPMTVTLREGEERDIVFDLEPGNR